MGRAEFCSYLGYDLRSHSVEAFGSLSIRDYCDSMR